MTGFIVSAVVLVVLALFFVLPAMLRKNQPISDEYDDYNVSIAKDRLKEIKAQRDAGDISEEVYQQMFDELESTLAIDLSNQQAVEATAEVVDTNKKPLLPILLSIILPVLAVALYSQLGNFDAATGQAMQSVSIPEGETHSQMTIQEAVAKLELRLAEQPDNPDGWFMLGKTYMSMSQYQKAVTAYEKTLELVGDDPQLLLAYADALAMTEGGNLTGVAKPVVEKVMQLIPDNPTALWMAGTAEIQQGNFETALSHWYKLRPMLAGEKDAQEQIEQLINDAESQLSEDVVAQLKQSLPDETMSATPVASSAAQITVNVELDPQYKDRASADDILFIFAKAMQGPPMPLAAVKLTAGALPLTVTLDDSMAMMPQMKLSSFETVRVSAVISKSGQPGAQPGDLFAEVSPVQTATQQNISLIINQVKQ